MPQQEQSRLDEFIERSQKNKFVKPAIIVGALVGGGVLIYKIISGQTHPSNQSVPQQNLPSNQQGQVVPTADTLTQLIQQQNKVISDAFAAVAQALGDESQQLSSQFQALAQQQQQQTNQIINALQQLQQSMTKTTVPSPPPTPSTPPSPPPTPSTPPSPPPTPSRPSPSTQTTSLIPGNPPYRTVVSANDSFTNQIPGDRDTIRNMYPFVVLPSLQSGVVIYPPSPTGDPGTTSTQGVLSSPYRATPEQFAAGARWYWNGHYFIPLTPSSSLLGNTELKPINPIKEVMNPTSPMAIQIAFDAVTQAYSARFYQDNAPKQGIGPATFVKQHPEIAQAALASIPGGSRFVYDASQMKIFDRQTNTWSQSVYDWFANQVLTYNKQTGSSLQP